MSCRIASTILRGFRNGPSLDISRAFYSKERKSAAVDSSIRSGQIANDSVPVFHVGRGGPLGTLFDIEAWEISTGRIVAIEDFPKKIKAMMKKHEVTWAEHKSVASQVLSHFRAKAHATLATPQYRAAQAKAGWRGLTKGRATQAKAKRSR